MIVMKIEESEETSKSCDVFNQHIVIKVSNGLKHSQEENFPK